MGGLVSRVVYLGRTRAPADQPWHGPSIFDLGRVGNLVSLGWEEEDEGRGGVRKRENTIGKE